MEQGAKRKKSKSQHPNNLITTYNNVLQRITIILPLNDKAKVKVKVEDALTAERSRSRNAYEFICSILFNVVQFCTKP